MKRERKLILTNPATGKPFRELSYHTIEEAISKIKTAEKEQVNWKQTPVSHRIAIIQDAMNYFRDNTDLIAKDITLQMGKPISQSESEIKGMLHRADIMCSLAEDALSETFLQKIDGYNRFIHREPLGVVFNIAAWNYPLLIAVNIVIPAILAGNTVIIKHSSMTPVCANHFEDAFTSARAPAGLVTSLILDHKTTENIIQKGLIHHVSFTGSVNGGRKINQCAKNQFIDVNLELGGKDPAYIRNDSDLESSIPSIMDGVFYNAGQSCCAVERIYVHTSLFDKFTEGAIEFMNQLIIDDPIERTTTLGPMAQKSGLYTVNTQLKDAENKGAEIIYHSARLPDGYNYILPSIAINVNHDMKIMKEETFGPVVGIMTVDSDEEAVNLMNDSTFGLTASVWTKNAEKAVEIGNSLATGTFFMNRCDYLDPFLPWVGVKDSGRGCSLSALGIQQLTRPKSFHLKLKG